MLIHCRTDDEFYFFYLLDRFDFIVELAIKRVDISHSNFRESFKNYLELAHTHTFIPYAEAIREWIFFLVGNVRVIVRVYICRTHGTEHRRSLRSDATGG